MRAAVRRAVAVLALAAATAIAASGPASAADLQPRNLRVAGGEAAWHADNDFRLDWDRPDGPVRAIHFQLRDAAGTVVIPAVRFPWNDDQLEYIRVPSGPGRYKAELWLEGDGGALGAPVGATLLFDDVRPGPTRVSAPVGWVAGELAATARFAHPAGPLPASGIRGYAVSVDRGSGSSPCAGPSRCKGEETDLSGGVDDDTISLGVLPEGSHVVRAVAVSGSGVRSAETSSAIVRVDASAPEISLTAPHAWQSGPVKVTATATDPLSGMAVSGPSGPVTAVAVDGGVPRTEAGAAATATVSGEGVHLVAAHARDAAGNSGDGAPRLATVRIDQTPPRVAFVNSRDPADPERIEATVADPLAGADPSRGSIAVRPAGSRQGFVALPTAVSAGRLVARWDSDSFPRGSYEFRATGFDAAGNSAASDRRADGARLVLVNPVKVQTEVVAGFGGRELSWQRCQRRKQQRRCRQQQIRSFESRPTARTVPYGRPLPYSGLLTSGGSELGGQAIEIVESFAPGSRLPRRTTALRTAADGSFMTRLGPGPSRRVEVVFAGSRTLTRAAGGEVDLRVQAGIRLRTSTASVRIGGAPVVFTGRIMDAGAALPVELQFRIPGGGDWSEFRTVATDAHGRFRYRYEFSDDDSRGVRFQFRAYIERGDWPYEPAASAPLFVTGY